MLPKKLTQRYVGRSTVQDRVGRLAYKLDFPDDPKTHPVVSVANLEPAPEGNDPWHRKPSDDIHLPTVDDRFPGEEVFEVDRILAKQVANAPGRRRRDGSQVYRETSLQHVTRRFYCKGEELVNASLASFLQAACARHRDMTPHPVPISARLPRSRALSAHICGENTLLAKRREPIARTRSS